jgi:hypothetical protein
LSHNKNSFALGNLNRGQGSGIKPQEIFFAAIAEDRPFSGIQQFGEKVRFSA